MEEPKLNHHNPLSKPDDHQPLSSVDLVCMGGKGIASSIEGVVKVCICGRIWIDGKPRIDYAHEPRMGRTGEQRR